MSWLLPALPVGVLVLLGAWALYLLSSKTAARAVFAEDERFDLPGIAKALGLGASQWSGFGGTLSGVRVVLSNPEPGVISLRDAEGRMRGLSARPSVARRVSGKFDDPWQDLGDEAVSLAFLRDPVRARVQEWIFERGMTIENGELRVPRSPGGDEVTRVRALADLLAALCRTGSVLSGLRAAAREESSSARRLRALEMLVLRFAEEPECEEACRTALADPDRSVSIVAGLFADESRESTLRESKADAVADAIQRLAPATRLAALTRIDESSNPVAAATLAQALLLGGWIEGDPAALESAARLLSAHGTADALPVLAQERDLAGAGRRDAIASAIAAIRRRFPETDPGGHLSVVATSGGELTVAKERGTVSTTGKTEP